MGNITYFGIVMMSMALAFGAQARGAEPTPRTVEAAYHTGYLPDGFDTNDHVQIVGEGLFSNSCYRPASTQVMINHETRTIAVAPTAYEYDGFCLQMLVPYHQVLEVGFLEAGTYKVVQDKAELGSLNVRATTNSSADDYLYAPISQAYLTSKGGKNEVKISGNFTKSCMKLVSVMVNVQTNVIAIQPISEIDEDVECVDGEYPFEKTVDLGSVQRGRYLLHVRSLNGKAVNNLVDIL